MKKQLRYILIIPVLMLLSSCEDFLELEPLDKVSAERLISDPNGIKMLMASLYNKLPVEDFRYNPSQGFNYKNDAGSTFVAHGWSTSFFTDDAIMSHGSGAGPVSDGYWDYSGIRQVNEILLQIKQANISEADRKKLESEAHFLRAYMYFALAKRYGGVPILS